jgi:hypothetical protein
MKIFFSIRCSSIVGVFLAAMALSQSALWAAEHHHAPPHGGTPVSVAEHKYHLELVRDGASGRMLAYVLDDELEKAVAVRETNFTLRATFAGRTESVEFKRALPASKPSEASSQFEARADWIKAATNFQGVIPAITLNGKTFTNIVFPFPKGTRHTH